MFPMAYLTTHHTSDHLSDCGFRQGVAGFFKSLQQGLTAGREFERLNALSDVELVRRGLTRQGLAAHVFNTIIR